MAQKWKEVGSLLEEKRHSGDTKEKSIKGNDKQGSFHNVPTFSQQTSRGQMKGQASSTREEFDTQQPISHFEGRPII